MFYSVSSLKRQLIQEYMDVILALVDRELCRVMCLILRNFEHTNPHSYKDFTRSWNLLAENTDSAADTLRYCPV